jgi:hypothetical protein
VSVTVRWLKIRFPPDAGICDRVYAEVATSPDELKSVMDRCSYNTWGFVLAHYKFNRLPAPQDVGRLLLQARRGGEQVFEVRYEADVFFNLFEAYPRYQIAFDKLQALIDRMNEGFQVVGVEIIGSSDPVEREMHELEVAKLRAEFLQRYFEAAGVKPDRIWTSSRAPSHSDTLEGRARDRSASVVVNLLREGATSRK